MARSAILFAMTMLVTQTSIAAPAKKKPEPEPALPAPSLKLKVTPAGNGGPWRLTIENTGESPVRIPADPRLLILDLTPVVEASPKKKPAPPPRCILPEDARPSTDEGRELVLPAKRSWSASFDPLMYCFGTKERAALAAGTTVKPTFGWLTKATKMAAPYAVAPVGASVGKVAPLKVIDGDAFVIGEAPLKAAESTTASGVHLAVPEAMDVARGRELGTTVAVVNDSERAVTLFFRSNMIEWKVIGPSGSVACGEQRIVGAPVRELFSTVAPKGRAETAVLFSNVCPEGTFDEPGIYRVSPKLDTTNASGLSVGLKTWDDVATTPTPMLLRVRSARRPAALAKPALD